MVGGSHVEVEDAGFTECVAENVSWLHGVPSKTHGTRPTTLYHPRLFTLTHTHTTHLFIPGWLGAWHTLVGIMVCEFDTLRVWCLANRSDLAIMVMASSRATMTTNTFGS